MNQTELAIQKAMKARAEGRVQEAADIMLRVVQREPTRLDAHNALGAMLNMLGQGERALFFAEKAVRGVEGTPREAQFLGQYLGTYATSLMLINRFDEAREAFDRALRLSPAAPTIWSARGSLALTEKDFDTAVRCFQRTAELLPDVPVVRLNLAIGLSMTAKPAEAAAEIERAARLVPANSPLLVSTFVSWARALNYVPGADPAAVCRVHVQAAELLARGATPRTSHANAKEPERKLRVGYVSADLRRHSVAYFLEPLLEHRDRDGFEVTLYSTHREEDEVSARLRAMSERWRSVAALDEAKLDAMIVEDGIDVLVDLSGLTDGHRMNVFARRPAPVQCTYLGYANTSGNRAIDVRIVDAFTDPPELEGEVPNAERRHRLARTMWAFAAPIVELDSARSPDAGDGIVFCSFNSVSKLHAGLAAAWGRILARVPGSKMLIKAKGASGAATQGTLRPAIEAAGVSPDRIEFVDWRETLEGHLGSYRGVDVGLDSWPFHGTTTTCEAMWMGVPVVTLVGRAHASRVGGSLLRAVSPKVPGGLEDLIATDVEGYVEAAARLAQDRARLATIRRTLRGAMQESELMDGPGLARQIEGVYRDAWRGWCAAT